MLHRGSRAGIIYANVLLLPMDRWAMALFGGGCNAPSIRIYTSMYDGDDSHIYMLRDVCIGSMYVLATACQVFACDV